MGIERELSYRMFHQREEQLEHVGYEGEARLYFAVATGDISLVKEYAQNYMKPDATGNEKTECSPKILSRIPNTILSFSQP